MEEFDLDSFPVGKTSRGSLTPRLGYPVEIPYIVVRGPRPGPTLLVTAGVHGAEYASIEATIRLSHTNPDKLTGTLVVLPILNVPGFFARSIYINPVDGKNLNRVFPGKTAGTFTERLALWVTESFIHKADAYIDLHGGDLIESLTPFAICAQGDSRSLELAKVFGLRYIIMGSGSGMSFMAGSGRGVPSVLAEAGGQGQWPDQEVQRLNSGVERVMQHLGMLPGDPEPVEVTTLTRFAWLRAEATGLWYARVTAGIQVEAGQIVGVITDAFGKVLQEAIATVGGVVLFAVSSLAINEGDPLVGIGA